MESIREARKGKRTGEKNMTHFLLIILYAIGILVCVYFLYSIDGRASAAEKKKGEQVQ